MYMLPTITYFGFGWTYSGEREMREAACTKITEPSLSFVCVESGQSRYVGYVGT